MRIGYGRVSLREPDRAPQRDALAAAGCSTILFDVAVGRAPQRAELDRALQLAVAGDELVITRLDRIDLPLQQLACLVADLQARSVDLVVLDQGINTAADKTFFVHLAALAVADFDHSSERIAVGKATAARVKGTRLGPAPKLTPEQAAQAREMYEAGGHTMQQIADAFGVAPPTIYNRIRHLGTGQWRTRRPDSASTSTV